jgi:hypothetical protein
VEGVGWITRVSEVRPRGSSRMKWMPCSNSHWQSLLASQQPRKQSAVELVATAHAAGRLKIDDQGVPLPIDVHRAAAADHPQRCEVRDRRRHRSGLRRSRRLLPISSEPSTSTNRTTGSCRFL